VINLREERDLLGRLLIIPGSRQELVPKLEKTIGEYKMSVVPRSLYIPGDKASLMHTTDEATCEPPDSASPSFTTPVGQPYRILIIDAMAVLQGMKKTPTMLMISTAFIKRIESMMIGYNEAHVVFDIYLDQSLKNTTRQKQAVSSIEFAIHPAMKLIMSLKEILSSAKS